MIPQQKLTSGDLVRQRILTALPGTILEISKRLGIPRGATAHHVKCLQGSQRILAVSAAPSPNGGRPVPIFGHPGAKAWAPPTIQVNAKYRSWLAPGYNPPWLRVEQPEEIT